MFGRNRKTTTEPDDATAVQEREPATSTATTVAPPAEERFTRDETTAAPATAAPAAEPRTSAPIRNREPLDEEAPARDWEPVGERRTLAPVVDEDTVVAMRARQRSRFGGI